MKTIAFLGAALAVSALVIWWISRPATCPRCGERPDPQRFRSPRYGRGVTCARCGCHFDFTTGDHL